MALPSTIAGAWSTFKNANHGPFQHTNGDLYIFALVTSGADGVVTAYRSTDNGDTWTAQSGGLTLNRTSGVTQRNGPFNVSKANGTYLLITAYTTTNSYRQAFFDMATNTWGAEGANSGSSNALTITTGYPTFAVQRSTGEVVVHNQGNNVTISMVDYRRNVFARMTSSLTVISTLNVIPATSDAFNYDPVGIVLGDADRVHFFYTRRNPANTTRALYHRSLSSANVLSAEAAVTSSINTDLYAIGQPYFDGTYLWVPYVAATTNSINFIRGSNADSPTWISQSTFAATENQGTETTYSNSVVMFSDAGKPAVVWLDSLQARLLYDKSTTAPTTLTWGTDTELTPPITFTQSTDIALVGQLLYGGTGTFESRGQSFTATQSGNVSQIAFSIYKGGTPTDNLYVEVSTSLGGAAIATSNNVAAANIAASGGNNTGPTVWFTFSTPFAVTASTKYYARILRTGARDTTNAFVVSAVNSNSYAGGDAAYRDNSVWTEVTTQDYAFLANNSIQMINGFSAAQLSSGIGYVYDLNGVLNYNTYPPPATTIPVSGSDSGTIGSSETLTPSAFMTNNDPDTISVTDTLASEATLTTSDSDTVSITEAIVPSALMAIADSGTISVTDTASITTSQTLSLSDSGTIGSTDTLVSMTSIMATSDSDTISETPTYSASSDMNIAENGLGEFVLGEDLLGGGALIGATEEASVVIAITLADTGTIGSSESLATAATLTSSDSNTITSSDALTTSTTLALTDSDTISVVDSATVVRTEHYMSLSDSGTISESNDLSIASTLTSPETAFIGSTSDVEIITGATLETGDNVALGATESLAGASSLSVTDSDTIDAAEEVLIDISIAITDSDTLSIVDELATEGTLTDADSAVLSIVESLSSVVTMELDDSDVIAVSDILDILGSGNTNLGDTLLLTGSEDYDAVAVLTTGDSGSLAIDETFDVELLIDESELELSDSTTIGGTETIALQSTSTLTDADTIGVVEDLTALGDSDTLLSDADTISVLETISLSSLFAIQDNVALEGNEAWSSFMEMAFSDSGVLGALEHIDITIAALYEWVDDDSITSDDVFAALSMLIAGDTAALSSSVTYVAQGSIAHNDTVSISIEETMVITSYTTFTEEGILETTEQSEVVINLFLELSDSASLAWSEWIDVVTSTIIGTDPLNLDTAPFLVIFDTLPSLTQSRMPMLMRIEGSKEPFLRSPRHISLLTRWDTIPFLKKQRRPNDR